MGLGLSALGVLGLIALVAAGATVELVVPQVALTLGGFAVTYVNWLSLRLRAPSCGNLWEDHSLPFVVQVVNISPRRA